MATGPVNPTSIGNPLANSTGIQSAEEAKKTRDAGLADSTRTANRADQKGVDVQISAQAKERAEFQKRLLTAAKDSPDIREDRVELLKAQIAGGNYKVDTGKIADGMLREAVRDHLALSDK